jgi:hypothetical protein
VQLKLSIGVGSARDTSEGIFSAPRTELLAHVLGREETSVAALDKGFEMADSL